MSNVIDIKERLKKDSESRLTANTHTGKISSSDDLIRDRVARVAESLAKINKLLDILKKRV